jgi:hypothetical protein
MPDTSYYRPVIDEGVYTALRDVHAIPHVGLTMISRDVSFARDA